MSDTIVQAATWTVRTTVTRQVLEQAIQVLGGRVVRSNPDGLVAEFGSRLGFRLLGGYIGDARRRFPLRLTAKVAAIEDGMSHISVTVTGNEGWYLVRLPVHSRLFNERSEEILSQLRAATYEDPATGSQVLAPPDDAEGPQ